jgi:hypothetical protein
MNLYYTYINHLKFFRIFLYFNCCKYLLTNKISMTCEINWIIQGTIINVSRKYILLIRADKN